MAISEFDRIHGAWMGMIAGNNNGLFFENKYGRDALFGERIDGILTSIHRDKHTTWAFNVYDILLRFGSMVDDDTIMEWLLVEEILTQGRLPSHRELGMSWVNNLNYRNFGEGRFALEQFERGIFPPHHLDDDSGLTFTEHSKDWGICAQIYLEMLGLLLHKTPERIREVALYYASMTNRQEGCEAAVYSIAMQAAAMWAKDVSEVIDYGLSLMDADTFCAKQMCRARDLALSHEDWHVARNAFLDELPKHYMADAIPNCGIVTMALIYGKGSFEDTMSLVIEMGYDTDCTASTVGGILGAMIGESHIPGSWKDLLLGTFNNMIWDKWDNCQRYDKYAWLLPESIKIDELARRTQTALHLVSDSGAALPD